MPTPSTPANPRLYESVAREARQKFRRWPSAYGSAWLVKEYKARGGTYQSRRSPKASSRRKRRSRSPHGVGRWMREEWVQVIPYLKHGRRVACGARKDAAKACRPLRRVSSETPLTISELVRLHGAKRVLDLAAQKTKDMDGRVHWERGAFYGSG